MKRARKGTDLFSESRSSTGFALTASHFLFARAKEKATKDKARPASGFRGPRRLNVLIAPTLRVVMQP